MAQENDSNTSSASTSSSGAATHAAPDSATTSESRGARMPPLSLTEVASISISLQSMIGAQLQDCLQTANEIGLAFYHNSRVTWLWFDLQPQRPIVVRIENKAPNRKKIQRPLTLFLKSRFTGRRLASVRAEVSLGRILIFSFHRAASEETDEPIEIEARLFPHGQNIIARDGKKSIAENKPQELPLSTQRPGVVETARSWESIEDSWRALQAPKTGEANANPNAKALLTGAQVEAAKLEREWKRAIEKKEKALTRMAEELETKTSRVPRDVGDWLKTHGTVEVPQEWREHVDASKSLSWNIEKCFHRAKENERKSDGTRARIVQVTNELEDLKKRGPNAFARGREKQEKKEDQNLLSRAEARGRRLKIGEDLEVYIGKSAADNLAILRRAQSFDYWLHLRDQPGSHAILRRTRSRMITDAEFAEAGRWVVEQSLGSRAYELKGERFDLLIVECRFVRPIKGDKIGRVNYTNDRVMTLRF